MQSVTPNVSSFPHSLLCEIIHFIFNRVQKWRIIFLSGLGRITYCHLYEMDRNGGLGALKPFVRGPYTTARCVATPWDARQAICMARPQPPGSLSGGSWFVLVTTD